MILPEKALFRLPLGEERRDNSSCRLLVDGMKDRAPAVIVSKHRIEVRKKSRCFSVGLPTPQIDRHLVVRKNVFRGSTVPHLKPTATAWLGRKRDEHIRVKRRRAVAAAILLRDACLGGKRAKCRLRCHSTAASSQLYCCATRAWGGSAQSTGSRAMAVS